MSGDDYIRRNFSHHPENRNPLLKTQKEIVYEIFVTESSNWGKKKSWVLEFFSILYFSVPQTQAAQAGMPTPAAPTYPGQSNPGKFNSGQSNPGKFNSGQSNPGLSKPVSPINVSPILV